MQTASESSGVRRWRNEIDRLFNQVGFGGVWAALYGPNVFRPATDVFDTDEALWVRVEIAGVREEDFRVALVDGTLIIAGVRRDTTPKRGYHQMEISWGPFQTEVQVGFPVREDEIEAHYEDGFLIVRLPKAHRRHIPVQNRDEE